MEREVYFSRDYDTKERFCSYWHQIDEVVKLEPGSVLEVGPGNGFVAEYLRSRGIDLVTVDSDPSLRPDVTGTVIRMPFKDESFDVVTCCEVLEHIPYDSFQMALSEVHRVCRSWVVLSLPDKRRKIHIGFRSDRLGYFRAVLRAPRLSDPAHRFDGQHYWEIGKASYPLRRVLEDIESAGFAVRSSYFVPENPYHIFFVLRKTRIG